MTNREEINALYPELLAAGSVEAVINAALERVGSDARATRRTGGRDPTSLRSWGLSIAAEQRLWMLGLYRRGIEFAMAGCSEIEPIARVIDRWMTTGPPMAEMAAEFDFLEPRPCASAYERGEEVEWKWQSYLKASREHWPELADFFEAASRRPELRQLYPFTSHDVFSLSRCTAYPFTDDIPCVWWDGDAHTVRWSRRKEIGRGNAEEAVEIVLAHLPPNCGPAVFATADELDR